MKAGLLALTLLAVAGSATWSAEAQTGTARVDEIIAKTRRTSVTYSLYAHSVLNHADGTTSDEWAAEFNSGNLHRVETAHDRLIANCSSGEGTYLDLTTRKISHEEWVAKAACGINSNRAIQSSKVLGTRDTRFGPVDRITVADDANVRTYDVTHDGVIVGSTIADQQGKVLLRTWACSLAKHLPKQDIFDEASLQSSAVPEPVKQSVKSCKA